MEFFECSSFLSLLSNGLSLMGCSILFFKYYTSRVRSTGITIVLTLVFFNFLSNLFGITEKYFQSYKLFKAIKVFAPLFIFISIYWSASMSYFAYKSLKEENHNLEKSFEASLSLLIPVSAFLTLFLHQ